MSKRQIEGEEPTWADAESSKKSVRQTKGGKADQVQDVDERGEFEDPWEDEFEEEEEVVSSSDGEDGSGDEMIDATEDNAEENEMADADDVNDDLAQRVASVYLPNTAEPLADDEHLEVDQSAYVMLHKFTTTWPCLSFDTLTDPWGEGRDSFPHEMLLVAGTQAAATSGAAGQDELTIMRLGEMWKTQNDDESDDDEDSHPDDNASLDFRTIPHPGSVNRVRAAPLSPSSATDCPYYVASWSDSGRVGIWNMRPFMTSLTEPGSSLDRRTAERPAHVSTAHGRTEGFALDWSASDSNLRLLSGDCSGKIHLTSASSTSWSSRASFVDHSSSVEDLQWSPSESTVFASCSADRSIRIWDVRVKGRKSVLSAVNAHAEDVNVISWSKGRQNYLLASGGDEGNIKIWDLRIFKSSNQSAIANFQWHRKAITSIEWNPTEDSVLAASSADDQVTLWDLSVEKDTEEKSNIADQNIDIPDQLLFVHQGQKDIKEIHWHRQIPGAMITTALDGFNIFKTISV